MKWEWNGVQHENCAVVFRVKEEFGGLSNMHNGYPLCVAGQTWRSSEALYQACRYPHEPQWQREILEAPHAMRAKMASKKEGRRSQSRSDWNDVRSDIMRWCLRIKSAQHFSSMLCLLKTTGNCPIVERSRRDRFWGAVLEKDDVLRGENWLGRLLMELRNEMSQWMLVKSKEKWPGPELPSIDQLVFLGRNLN